MKLAHLIPVFAAAIAFPTAASAQYPIIFNHAKDTDLSAEACVRNAGAAMKRAGFTENFEFIGQGAFGVRGRYSATIRCETEKGIVFFAVAGPDNRTADNLVVHLWEQF